MMACFKWYLNSLAPHQLKKSQFDPSDKTFWILVMTSMRGSRNFRRWGGGGGGGGGEGSRSI